MSDMQEGTVKERLVRIETLLCNHLVHDARRTNWLLGILSAIIVGIILRILPGFCAWFGTL